jgi:oligopeptide/dipeptide ABC transporter ATP-binding protein
VDGVSLRIQHGETLGLVGESGSGKTTVGRAVLQLVRPSKGTIRFEGVDLAEADAAAHRHLRRYAQMIFQDPYSSLNPRMKVGDILREPLDIHRVGSRAARQHRVSELIHLAGLPGDTVYRYPHEFSGGQRQRIAIARALVLNPSLVVCDEPVAALDVSIRAQILELFKDLQRDIDVAYLFIAHGLDVVQYMADRTAVMYLGKIVEEGPSVRLFQMPRHPYTQALLSAIPVPDPDVVRWRMVLEGEIPSPVNVPSGCRFRTRCPFVQALCISAEPALEAADDGVSVACHFWREIEARQVVR